MLFTRRSSKYQYSITAILALALLSSLAIGSQSPSFAFGKKKTTKASSNYSLPQRNFLPPVASINPIIEADTIDDADNDINEVVMMPAVTPTVLKASPKITTLDTDLGIRNSDVEQQKLRGVQEALDNEDLDRLWKATVERNPVIQFSLEKVHAPTEIQKKQSSMFMKKTLNVLITGATMATTMIPGGGSYRNIGAMAVGDATRNMALGPQAIPDNILSATEKIQLAGLVDELQGTLIQTYHDYKRTLGTLADAHQNTVQSNVRYSIALDSQNKIAILAAGTAYYKALIDETRLRQEAKIARLKLERLSGADAVKELKLTVAYNPEAQDRMSQNKINENINEKNEEITKIKASEAEIITAESSPPEPLLDDSISNTSLEGE